MTDNTIYKRAIAALAIVFVIFLTAYFIVNGTKSKTEQAELLSVTPISLFSFNADDISQVVFSDSEDGSFIFDYNGSDWDLQGNAFEIYPDNIIGLVTIMSALDSTRTITDKPEDLSIYGLDNPTKITCTLNSGTSYTASVGAQTPNLSGYYLQRDGDPSVYTISYENGGFIALDKDAFKDPYIIDAIYSDITYLYLEREGEKILEFEKTDSWHGIYPIDATTNLANISTVNNALIRVTCADFIEENCHDPSKYGIDEPSAVFKISTADRDVTLLFGKKNLDGDKIYAMFEDSRQVVIYNLYDVNFINTEAVDFYDTVISMTYLTDLSAFDVNLEGEMIHCTSNMYDDVKEYSINGVDLTDDSKGRSYFESFFSGAVGIYFSSVEPNAEPDMTVEPVISIHYDFLDGTERLVEYYRKDSINYYAVIDGEYTGFVVREKVIDDVNGIRRTYSELKAYLD